MDRNDQRTVIQFESRGTDNQRWEIRQSRDGGWTIRNMMNGNALEEVSNRNAAPVQANPFNGNAAQSWRIENGKDGNALIVSNSGKALDIPDGSDRNGIRVQVFDRNGDSNQRFQFRRVANAGSGRFNDRMETGRGNDRFNNNDPYGRGGDRYNNDRSSRPDRTGRYWDDRERMWKLEGDGVCFYSDRNFGGDAYCARRGEDAASLGGDWQNRIGSVKFFGRAREVEVFNDSDFRGRSSRVRRDETDLRIGRVSSFRIY
jgi:hypothetical protein